MVYNNALTLRTSREVFVVSPRRFANQDGSARPDQTARNCWDSFNSPSAVSPSTGRVAMGPWQGAFGKSNADTGSPIYLDSAGSGHFSLTDFPAGNEAQRVPQSPPAGAADA